MELNFVMIHFTITPNLIIRGYYYIKSESNNGTDTINQLSLNDYRHMHSMKTGAYITLYKHRKKSLY